MNEWMKECTHACLSLCLSICPSVFLSALRPSAHLSFCPSGWLVLVVFAWRRFWGPGSHDGLVGLLVGDSVGPPSC